jgi:hypothetical protein
LGKGKTAPAGSFLGFTTHLVGVNFDGTPTDLKIGFSWKTTFNGTSGGASTTKSSDPVDLNSGTGEISVTDYQPTTDYDYQGFSVTSVITEPVPVPALGTAGSIALGVMLLAAGVAAYRRDSASRA